VTAPRGPAIDRVAAVAADLGDLATRVVFIGGAIAPLLQTDPLFPRARVTSDVDGVVASSTYAESQRLHRELATRGFRQAIGDTKHVHRWIGPSGIPFDLVPAGEHLGGSGNPWDVVAIETAVEATIGEGITIRHVSASAFLAQKWAAHHDRGRGDPLGSHDLEDILALLASRPTIVEEAAAAPAALRAYVAEQARTFLADANAEDLLAAHLNNAQDPAATITGVRTMLKQLSGP
jgi:Nucleotidyl transferase AbiEii toxin, Type IV TA system